VVGEDVGDEKKGGLEHERKRLDYEPESRGGAGWPALAPVQVHGRVSFEGPLGEYCEDGDEEESCGK